MDIIDALLDKLGVIQFAGTHPDTPAFTRANFHKKYDRAFKGSTDEEPFVVVAIGGDITRIFIVNDVDQLWACQEEFGANGVRTVYRLPQKLWEKIRPKLTSVVDLDKVSA